MVALYLNLFDSEQMEKQGGERGGTEPELQQNEDHWSRGRKTMEGGFVCDQRAEVTTS